MRVTGCRERKARVASEPSAVGVGWGGYGLRNGPMFLGKKLLGVSVKSVVQYVGKRDATISLERKRK